jgi:predicted dehydrogenase
VAERIRWGIAGTGGIASAFAADLALLPDAELVAVGSRSQEAADAFADRFSVPHRHIGYVALAADPEVDAIYVAVPHTGHLEATLAAVEGGKAVLCEKPFAVSAKQAEQMIAAARAKGTFLMEGMWVRFLPHLALVRSLIAQGRIGRVRSVVADRCDILSADPRHRVRAPELAGGALLDLGIYPVSLASMVTGGQPPARVEAVAALTDTGVDAHASMVLQYPDGAHALVTTSLELRGGNTATISGTEGRIVISQPWARTSPVELILLDGTTYLTHLPHEGHGLRHQAAEVGARLRAGETESPVMPWHETLSVMRTLDAVRERIGLRYPGE